MLSLAWQLARRELRGGIKGFRVFLACLTLGVAAIAGVGSVSTAIVEGLRADAKSLLGGDVDLMLTHRTANAEQRAWLIDNSAGVSEVANMRAMAVKIDGSDRKLVELKAVDSAYPLYGDFEVADADGLHAAIARDAEGIAGAVVAPHLMERLSLQLGSQFRLGDAVFRVAGVVANEPDRSTQAFNLGPRIVVSHDALADTGLVQPGSLIRNHYRIALPPDVGVAAWTDQLKETFPQAGWRIRDLENAAPNIQRFVDRVGLFLTLVGLTALVVGGVGVGNAVRAFLASRAGTIATLKCLGAPSATVFATYLMQVLVLALVGIAIGLTLGALVPIAAAPVLSERLPVEARVGLYWEPLVRASLFGILVTLAFSIWPLARARSIPAASLFRDLLAPATVRPGWRTMAVLAAICAALTALAVAGATDRIIAIYFVAGAVAALISFRLVAWGVMTLAAKLPRPRGVRAALALANLHRPGAPTGSVVVSLGLGLTVLVAVALIETNLRTQLADTLRGEAPGYFFIDIQPNQIDDFRTLLEGFDGMERSADVPMLRGRIAKLQGTPVEEIIAPPEAAWVLRGDRGVTWSRQAPEAGSEIVAGSWWPEDYSGKPLVSFDAQAARALKLEVGDIITVNLLGREFDAEIANLRQIDWTSFGINFVMIFSPGLVEKAPQSYIATAHLPADREVALERAVGEAFPNVSAIRVKEVLDGVNELLANLAVAVRIIASVAILAGVLVLAGAIAAGHARRVYDSVVLKVLGATRKDVLAAFLMEYGLMGLVTAGIASFIGGLGAYFVITKIMTADWVFSPAAVAITAALALAATVGLGFIGTWSALGRKAAPLLRNE